MKTLKQYLSPRILIATSVNPDGSKAVHEKAKWNGHTFEIKKPENSIRKGGLYFKDVSINEGLIGTNVITR